jgi:hypothetical protein
MVKYRKSKLKNIVKYNLLGLFVFHVTILWLTDFRITHKFPLKIWKLSKELLNFKTKTLPFPLPNGVVNIGQDAQWNGLFYGWPISGNAPLQNMQAKKVSEPTFLHQIKRCFGILFGLSAQVNVWDKYQFEWES